LIPQAAQEKVIVSFAMLWAAPYSKRPRNVNTSDILTNLTSAVVVGPPPAGSFALPAGGWKAALLAEREETSSRVPEQSD
jgi:hypothetical protein